MDEHFADMFWVNASVWSVELRFGIRTNNPDRADQPITAVRIPPAQAKMMAILLLRTMREVETKNGLTFPLPADVLAEAGISADEWDPPFTRTP